MNPAQTRAMHSTVACLVARASAMARMADCEAPSKLAQRYKIDGQVPGCGRPKIGADADQVFFATLDGIVFTRPLQLVGSLPMGGQVGQGYSDDPIGRGRELYFAAVRQLLQSSSGVQRLDQKGRARLEQPDVQARALLEVGVVQFFCESKSSFQGDERLRDHPLGVEQRPSEGAS